MIPYINHLLDQWGIWCISGRDKIGYPRQAAFLNGQPQPARGAPLAICDDDALQINRVVNQLDRDLQKLVTLFYVKMRSCDGVTIAKAAGCGRTKFYDELHRAHVAVMFWIQEDELNGK